eukprot:6196074-Pleurochrysis_carterae.AAC.1
MPWQRAWHARDPLVARTHSSVAHCSQTGWSRERASASTFSRTARCGAAVVYGTRDTCTVHAALASKSRLSSNERMFLKYGRGKPRRMGVPELELGKHSEYRKEMRLAKHMHKHMEYMKPCMQC